MHHDLQSFLSSHSGEELSMLRITIDMVARLQKVVPHGKMPVITPKLLLHLSYCFRVKSFLHFACMFEAEFIQALLDFHVAKEDYETCQCLRDHWDRGVQETPLEEIRECLERRRAESLTETDTIILIVQ